MSVGKRSSHKIDERMDRQHFLSFLMKEMQIYDSNPVDLVDRTDQEMILNLQKIVDEYPSIKSEAEVSNLAKRPPIRSNSEPQNKDDSDCLSATHQTKEERQNSTNEDSSNTSATTKLHDKILETFIGIRKKEIEHLNDSHPRESQLQIFELDKERETENSFFLLKALFVRLVWSAGAVTKKTIQNLLLFDNSGWLTSELVEYLELSNFNGKILNRFKRNEKKLSASRRGFYRKRYKTLKLKLNIGFNELKEVFKQTRTLLQDDQF